MEPQALAASVISPTAGWGIAEKLLIKVMQCDAHYLKF